LEKVIITINKGDLSSGELKMRRNNIGPINIVDDVSSQTKVIEHISFATLE
jgi:hypothetical protein